MCVWRRGGLVAQPGLLDRILGLAHTAQYPVGDQRTAAPAELLELLSPGRASHLGIRIGGFTPAHAARQGSHSLAGAGSSSTMLNTPFACCSTARTVALAASSRCTHEV